MSPLFQDSQQRNPIIKDPGIQGPGLTSSDFKDPGVVGHFTSFAPEPLFPDKQSLPFRPSPALVGVSEPELLGVENVEDEDGDALPSVTMPSHGE